MRKHRLNILAALSVITLAVLLSGYAFVGGVEFGWERLSDKALAFRSCSVRLVRGAFQFRWGDDSSFARHATAWWVNTEYNRDVNLRWANLQQTACEFLAGHTSSSNHDETSVSCPLWCLALPCMIAPALWLRRRRRRHARGFAVEPTASSTVS